MDICEDAVVEHAPAHPEGWDPAEQLKKPFRFLGGNGGTNVW
jgi:hypothetical protein